MLKIYIHGLKDGEYDIHLTSKVEELKILSEEFFGNVVFNGKMRIIGKRYTINGVAECMAKFECDLSLREFDSNIVANINCSYLANNELFYLNKNNGNKEFSEMIIHEDEKYIDLSTEIIEELTVNIPMKKVHPDFEGKNIEDIYPEYSANLIKENTRLENSSWDALKSIKFDVD